MNDDKNELFKRQFDSEPTFDQLISIETIPVIINWRLQNNSYNLYTLKH